MTFLAIRVLSPSVEQLAEIEMTVFGRFVDRGVQTDVPHIFSIPLPPIPPLQAIERPEPGFSIA